MQGRRHQVLEQGGEQPSSSDHPRDGREEALQQREQRAQQVLFQFVENGSVLLQFFTLKVKMYRLCINFLKKAVSELNTVGNPLVHRN